MTHVSSWTLAIPSGLAFVSKLTRLTYVFLRSTARTSVEDPGFYRGELA